MNPKVFKFHQTSGRPEDFALIDILWVGELKPDTFSGLIQYWLSLVMSWGRKKKVQINYSHNCLVFRFNGVLWHATTPDGVTAESPDSGLQGCAIRARKTVKLKVTNSEFAMWLMGERGKHYGHSTNVRGVIRWLFPFLASSYRDGDRKRTCSEFVAAACQFSDYKFPTDRDYLLPTDTAKVLKPEFY